MKLLRLITFNAALSLGKPFKFKHNTNKGKTKRWNLQLIRIISPTCSPICGLKLLRVVSFSALSELRIDCVFGGAIGGTTYIALVSCEQRATKKTCLGVLFLCKSADRNYRVFKGNQLISYQTAFFELNTNEPSNPAYLLTMNWALKFDDECIPSLHPHLRQRRYSQYDLCHVRAFVAQRLPPSTWTLQCRCHGMY